MAGGDYTAVSGTLTFAPSETINTIAVPTIEDSLVEPNKILTLFGAVGATIADSSGSGQIQDDD